MGNIYSSQQQPQQRKIDQQAEFWKKWYENTGHWDIGPLCSCPDPDDGYTNRHILNRYRMPSNKFRTPQNGDVFADPEEFWRTFCKTYSTQKDKQQILKEHKILGAFKREYYLLPKCRTVGIVIPLKLNT